MFKLNLFPNGQTEFLTHYATLNVLSFEGDHCEEGWDYYGDSCYFQENGTKYRASWQDAQSVCKSKRANLVTMNDENEMNFLDDILAARES